VFLVTPARTIEYRSVALGPIVDGLRVVRTGLNPGDRVVVNGLQRVQPGARVDPVLVAMDESAAAADPAVTVTGSPKRSALETNSDAPRATREGGPGSPKGDTREGGVK
jgi:hypothetical protein